MNDADLRNQFTAYLQKVVGHAKIDYIRRKAAQKPSPEISLSDGHEPTYEQAFRLTPQNEFDFAEGQLADAFEHLSLLRRKILTMLFVEGLTGMEVAERLGLQREYVYTEKRRALQVLHKQLSEGGDDHA